jgi:hypothetical protein
VEIGWVGCAIYQATPKWLTQLFSYLKHNYLIKNPQTTGWIGCAIYQATPKWLPIFFHIYSIII